MFFSLPVKTPLFQSTPAQEPLLPRCYDEFLGTKIYNIIQHPKPEGDRIFLRVPYAASAGVKARGARWDAEARRWWYWSGSVSQLEYDDDAELWVQALSDVHATSPFANWDMDKEFMTHRKRAFLDNANFFDYSNPDSASAARRK